MLEEMFRWFGGKKTMDNFSLHLLSILLSIKIINDYDSNTSKLIFVKKTIV